MSSFSKNLRMLRKERNQTQIETAEALGISQALLSLYENEARVPSMNFLGVVCDYFGVTADFLIGRTGLREAPEQTQPAAQEDGQGVQEDLKQLYDSIAVLIGLLDQLPDQDAAEAAKAYLNTSVYRLFRTLSGASPENAGIERNAVSADLIRSACSAEMSLDEIAYSGALEKARAADAIPSCIYPALKEAYPAQYQSLFTLLYDGDGRMETLLKSNQP